MTPRDANDLPRPRRRLWRTFLKQPRDLSRFAPSIPFDSVARQPPDKETLGRWGQDFLLDDRLVVLHRDGTASYLQHTITALHSPAKIAEWDTIKRPYDRRTYQATVHHASVTQPGDQPRPAKIRNRLQDRSGYLLSMDVEFKPLQPGVTVELAEQWDYYIPDQFGPGVWGGFPFYSDAPCRHRRFTLAVARPFNARLEFHNGATAPRESQIGN